jgi:hypothetical protein
MRSITTSRQVSPGTSRPCHNDSRPEQRRARFGGEALAQGAQLLVALTEDRERPGSRSRAAGSGGLRCAPGREEPKVAPSAAWRGCRSPRSAAVPDRRAPAGAGCAPRRPSPGRGRRTGEPTSMPRHGIGATSDAGAASRRSRAQAAREPADLSGSAARLAGSPAVRWAGAPRHAPPHRTHRRAAEWHLSEPRAVAEQMFAQQPGNGQRRDP